MASSPTAPAFQGMLLSHLPAVFQGSQEEDLLLREFLAPFEDLLFGEAGLHSIIGSLAGHLDARNAPVEFLPWLASWMGTTLYRQLPEAAQREFVANASDYYRHRGTRANLKRLLELFIRLTVQIDEPDFPMFQVGIDSTIGLDSYIQGGPPHAFRVTVRIPAIEGMSHEEASTRIQQLEALARAVIDLEKPAHTTYELELSVVKEAVTIESLTSRSLS